MASRESVTDEQKNCGPLSLIVSELLHRSWFFAGPPHIVSKSETRHLIGAGETLRLTCLVEAVPPAIITWQKDGDMIHPGWDRYRTNEHAHTLKIKDLETTDSGVFTCLATNGFGSVKVTYLVYVYGKCSSTSEVYSNIPDKQIAESQDSTAR